MFYRCKVCGGELSSKEGQTVVKCEYCGNINAIPKTTDDNLNELLNRADELRRNCEFDSAEKAYERIIDINPKEADAEAYKMMAMAEAEGYRAKAMAEADEMKEKDYTYKTKRRVWWLKAQC